MGFKQSDLVYPGSTGPTAISPASKSAKEGVFQVLRTDTVAVLKDVLPADASLIAVTFYGSVASNAATTATVTFSVSNNTGVISTGVVDVKANGATTALVQMSNLPNLENIPLQGDIKITAVYAETGGASTLGGPWTVGVRSVR
jgi:hypothetical protein